MDLKNFDAGLWIPRQAGLPLPSNALLEAADIVYEGSGYIRGRKGRSTYVANVNSTYEIQSMWRHYPRSGDPITLIQTRDAFVTPSFIWAKLFYEVGAVVTFLSNISLPGLVYFANWPSKNATFLATGSGIYKVTTGPVAIAAVTQTSVQTTGPYITVHQSRLVTSQYDEINYSVYFSAVDDETVTNSSSGVNQLNFSDPQGGSITGLVSLAGSANVLLVLKNTNLWRVAGDLQFNAQKDRYSEIGCVAPRSVAVVNDSNKMGVGVFFVGRYGVYYADGINPPTKISDPIDSLFTNPPTLYSGAVGYYWPRYDLYEVYLSSSHNVSYVVQRVRELNGHVSWRWSTIPNRAFTAAVVFDSESDTGDAYLGTLGSSIYQLDQGTTDSGTTFYPTIRTNFLPLSPDSRKGRVHRLELDYYGSDRVLTTLRYDNASAADVSLYLGEKQTAGVQQVQAFTDRLDVQGKSVSIGLRLPPDGSAAEFYRLGVDVRLRSKRDF